MGIGKGNDGLDNLMAKVQAAAESFTPAYREAEKEVDRISLAVEEALEDLGRFNTIHRDYEKDLKLRNRNRLLDEISRSTIEAELLFIDDERNVLQNCVESQKTVWKQAKKKFADEKKQPGNSKAFGQPLRAKCDEILKRRGIDRAAQFGGDLEGNGVRRLMAEANAIIDEIEGVVLEMDRVAGTDDEIRDVCEKHRQLFLCWDGYFSGLRTKRFHLTDDITQKTKQYLAKSISLEWHLCMSITPKSHVMAAHSIEQLVRICGFADLAEDAGERNHQDESKADKRLGAIRDYPRKEEFKSKDEFRKKNPVVQEKIEQLREKNKRNTSGDAEARQIAKRQKRIDAREEALASPVPEGKMKTLRRIRSEII
jgi:hypothetical protein